MRCLPSVQYHELLLEVCLGVNRHLVSGHEIMLTTVSLGLVDLVIQVAMAYDGRRRQVLERRRNRVVIDTDEARTNGAALTASL